MNHSTTATNEEMIVANNNVILSQQCDSSCETGIDNYVATSDPILVTGFTTHHPKTAVVNKETPSSASHAATVLAQQVAGLLLPLLIPSPSRSSNNIQELNAAVPAPSSQSHEQTSHHIVPPLLCAATAFLLIMIVAAAVKYVKYVLRKHTAHFAGIRLSRCHGQCQSSTKLDPPAVRSWSTFRRQQGKLKEIITSNPRTRFNHKPAPTSKHNNAPSTSAKEHNMDHVYINFFQFLWAFLFVGPASYFLWKKAIMILKLRIYLVEKMGWRSMKKAVSNLEEVVGKLLLEQSQVIHYIGQRKEQQEDGTEQKIASFFFPDFPMVDIDGKFQVANYLAVEVDLGTKRMVSCTLDDECLNASEALILLWYNTISAQHVKVHAYGNWGTNPGDEMRDINPYYERSSVVSVIYNYFGFTCFPSFMESWKQEGLLSRDWDPTALTDTFIHGVKENICEHSNITELLPYSDMVEFITKTRWIFHNEFRKHRHLFPGVNAEGLFAATVLHSLDHELMEWNLDDPLWLDVKDARFGKMAELGRVVRVGFVPQVPGYYFNRFFKGSGHPFFEAVYAKASKVNKEMADCLETCICR